MTGHLKLSNPQAREIIEHVDRHLPFEACGLLAGRQDRVEKVIPVQNQVKSPVRFVMDPYEQLQAFDWIDEHDLELVGIFHSHPTGPETASPTDIAEAAYDVVHMICSKSDTGWKLRGFWIENGEAAEVALQFVS